ncbi:acetylxylan esterase, partial [Streptomyces sp. NPDC005921]
MALFDLPLDELREHRSESVAPEDFDAFWSKTLQEARELSKTTFQAGGRGAEVSQRVLGEVLDVTLKL